MSARPSDGFSVARPAAAAMQPYFLPYMGYFQLMGAVDRFVVYDRIKYTKKGWINRNRLLREGRPAPFSLALAQASDQADVCERRLASSFDRSRLIRQFDEAYRAAPQRARVMPLLEHIVRHPAEGLFDYLHHGLQQMHAFLGLRCELLVSSKVERTAGLRGPDRVLSLCRDLGARTYINPIGGTELYQSEAFESEGLALRFLRARLSPYAQAGSAFVPALSIVDVLMFNALEQVRALLEHDYDLLPAEPTDPS